MNDFSLRGGENCSGIFAVPWRFDGFSRAPTFVVCAVPLMLLV